MSHFNDSYYHKPGRSRWGSFMLMLLGAIAGSLIALFLVFNIPYFANQLSPPEVEDRGQVLPPVIPSQPPEGQWPVVEIAEKVGPAVVGITNVQEVRGFFGSPRAGNGSGVIFDQEGYVVTNYHVIEGAREVIVTIDEERSYPAEVIGADRSTDLAVLKIDADNLPVARFGNSHEVKVGELAVAIGNPLGPNFARSVTSGVISALDRELEIQDLRFNLIQTDAAINPGNSGGALVNRSGEVIGINSAKIATAQVEGMGFAIPISSAKPIIDELIEQGYVSRPYIGIVGQEITEQQSQWYDLPKGIFITEVEPGGPAQRAGIRAEDIIVAIDDNKLTSFDDLKAQMDKRKPGDELTVGLIRKGESLKVTVELGERPAD
ncbi:serine protease Do [Desulfitispora alkaliphila]|uniref:S1C family serine protease n=1 Tax=Desulfitispora alkaliphila TaxID=622674 RepID=UPI003D235102